jgi:hypothetical protein
MSLVLQWSVIVLFLGCTVRVREARRLWLPLFVVAWNQEAALAPGRVVRSCALFGAGGVIVAALLLTFDETMVFGVLGMLMLGCYLVAIVDERYRDPRRWPFSKWIGRVGGAALKVVAWLGAAMFVSPIAGWIMKQSYYGHVQSVLLVLLCVATVAIIWRRGPLLFDVLIEWMDWSVRKYAPGSFSREVWRSRLAKSRARRQARHLLRTDHQSVSLSPSQYLALLKECEPLIRHEPALSVYWSAIDQLEQALRQERSG